MTTKPHLGRILLWRWHAVLEGMVVCGKFDGHPRYHGRHGWTSKVVAFCDTGENIQIETRNSRYTLPYQE